MGEGSLFGGMAVWIQPPEDETRYYRMTYRVVSRGGCL